MESKGSFPVTSTCFFFSTQHVSAHIIDLVLVFKTHMKRWKGIFYIDFCQIDDDVEAEFILEVQC